MVTINLLPWRDKQAQYEKQMTQWLIIGSVMLSLVIILVFDRILNYHYQATVERIETLNKEIHWREGLTKANMLTTILSPDNLPEFFNKLLQSDANDVCLEKIKKQKDQIILTGITDSPESLTAFLHHSPVVAHFSEIKIKRMQSAEDNQFQFDLEGKLHAV